MASSRTNEKEEEEDDNMKNGNNQKKEKRKKQKMSTSKYNGVTRDGQNNLWRASIERGSRQTSSKLVKQYTTIGRYKTEVEAAKAFDVAAKESPRYTKADLNFS
jgi:hypothetical protein